jgi:hypothetical protein
MINVTRYLCPSVLVALLRVVSTCGYGAPYTYGDLTRCVLNMSQFDKCGDDFTALKEGGSIELVIHRSSMGSDDIDPKYCANRKRQNNSSGRCFPTTNLIPPTPGPRRPKSSITTGTENGCGTRIN